MTLDFEWDERKATANELKHGVTFEEATTAFDDPAQISDWDEVHSTVTEDRYYLIGFSDNGRLLKVVYTTRSQNERIISAREANVSEQREYDRA